MRKRVATKDLTHAHNIGADSKDAAAIGIRRPDWAPSLRGTIRERAPEIEETSNLCGRRGLDTENSYQSLSCMCHVGHIGGFQFCRQLSLPFVATVLKPNFHLSLRMIKRERVGNWSDQ